MRSQIAKHPDPEVDEDGITESPEAGLKSHAVGLEMGPKSDAAASPHAAIDEEEGEEQLPPRRSAIPFHSSREEQMAKISGKLLWFFYGCGTIFASIILWQLIAQHKEKHVIAWSVGAIFVGIAVPFSLNDIYMHTLHVRTCSIHRAFSVLPPTPLHFKHSSLLLPLSTHPLPIPTHTRST